MRRACLAFVLCLSLGADGVSGAISLGLREAHPQADLLPGDPELVNRPAEGFRGIWYYNQKLGGEYVYKYSGGLGTYCAGHVPMAVYAPAVQKTFFVFGGTTPDNATLLQSVSSFDHATGTVARPTVVYDKHTTDAHDNAVLGMDDRGRLFLFSASHGKTRPSAVARSKRPYDCTEFEEIWRGNFSYPQPFFVPGKGFVFLHTAYQDTMGRRANFVARVDPETGAWSARRQLCFINDGDYMRSWQSADGRIGVAFDQHPKGKPGLGLNYRTDLYYMETRDGGETWVTADGTPLALPLVERENPALVFRYAERNLNVYVKGVAFDDANRPLLLYMVSGGYESGPKNGPRRWKVARHDGRAWQEFDTGIVSDNNYDFGALFVGKDGSLRLIGATEKGPQPYNPGGEIAAWRSKDGGRTWAKERDLTACSTRNQNYPRRVLGGSGPGFLTFWADGDGRKPSVSRLSYCDENLNVGRLPLTADDLTAWPPGAEPAAISRRITEQFLSSDPLAYKPEGTDIAKHFKDGYGWTSCIFYATASLWATALDNARLFGERSLEERLVARFREVLAKRPEVFRPQFHVDYNVVGAVPLVVARLTGDARAKSVGLALADYQWSEPKEAKQIIGGYATLEESRAWWRAGYSGQTRLWIDDMYMINLLQTEAYRLTGERKYVDRAAKEMCLYLDRLQLSDGLFHHAPDVPFVWGRGAGWMASGMPLVLKALPADHPCREKILAGYRRMMASLLRFQREDGLWGQLVDDPTAWGETSGSAMFAYGMAEGIANGWLDRAAYAPAVRHAWLSLCRRLDARGNVADVCIGTNKKNDRGYYLARERINGDPHGQAPMAWLAGVLGRCGQN